MDAGCTGKFSPGVRNRTDLTAIHLTLPATHAAPGSLEYIYIHMSMIPPKKYNPPYIVAHQLCFWAFEFVRAPLPSWIARTIGTLSYRNILLSSHS